MNCVFKNWRVRGFEQELAEDTLNRNEKSALNSIYGFPLTIKNVIFNGPATIVFWTDGTKTIVKCQEGDAFDSEKGLAMAFVKKILGNKGNYCNEFKKWIPKEEPKKSVEALNTLSNEQMDILNEAIEKEENKPDELIILCSVFNSRAEAKEILHHMGEIISVYGHVSVVDLYDMCGYSCPYTYNKYGWTNLDSAFISDEGHGLVLFLPKAKRIELDYGV